MAYHEITIEDILQMQGYGLDLICDADWQSVFAAEKE